MKTYSEDDYYRHIVGQLEEDDCALMEFVATPEEWMKARAALERFIAEQDKAYIDLIDNPDA